MSEQPKLTFPQIRRIDLESFTLYNLAPDVSVDVPPGVFCLAGANGLGKSTFLAAINYALTGIVPDPDREFKSVKEYVHLGSGFSDFYFDGRIAESDRDRAAITIHFNIGWRTYEVTRGFFENRQLRRLTIKGMVHTKGVSETYYDGTLHEGDDDDGEARQRFYERTLTEDVGLDSYDQFVFFQHFVLTFDESRHLLLWDRKVLNQVLYLAIGTDYSLAERADGLRREMERAGSRARNRNYAASNVRSRIQMLREAMGGQGYTESDPDSVKIRHKKLVDEVNHRIEDVERMREQMDDAQLRWMDASANLAAVQTEYAKAFEERTEGRVRVDLHPTVEFTLNGHACAICGTSGPDVAGRVQASVEAGLCPLCESRLPKPNGDGSVVALVELDRRIAEARTQLREALLARDRIATDLKVAEDTMTATKAELKEFEAENESITATFSAAEGGVTATIESLRLEMEELLRQKKEEYRKRDAKRREFLKLQRELQARYIEAEEEFVPLFRELASLFIGIDLEMRLDENTSTTEPGLSLILEMRGQARRKTFQMSESQRFFLDIALRMALIQYTSSPTGPATLLVDTPEGSLDITYESRAGQMFARFADNGHDLIMTANINSSELLLSLAHECGAKNMKLHRMIEWTELSDVQHEGSALFDRAYDKIIDTLKYSGNDVVPPPTERS